MAGIGTPERGTEEEEKGEFSIARMKKATGVFYWAWVPTVSDWLRSYKFCTTAKALFSFEKISNFDTVALSFICNK